MEAKLISIPLIFLAGSYLANPAWADDFIHAKTLLKENKPEQAYQHLLGKEAYHMGEPEYDLLLARAALKAGHPHEAIFGYERVLIGNPNNIPARVEMAIAYFQINELENSRRNFTIALSGNPPENISTVINGYLQQIDEKIDSRKHSLTGVLTLRQGWDSNINSATNESAIELTIGTYRPTEGVDKQTSDTFTEVTNRLKYNYHFNINSEFFSSLGYSNRENNNKHFDRQSADIKLGYSHKTDLGKLSVPVSYQTMWLDERQLLEIATISTGLNQTYEGFFTDYNLQYGEIRYPDQQTLDVDYIAASLALGTNNNQAVANQQYILFYGDETPANGLYQFNAREYLGAQIRLPIRLTLRHYLTPRMVYQVAEYKAHHPFFISRREDRYASIELDWNWYVDRKWHLTAQISHTESESSVGLYTYSRTAAFVGINFQY